MAYETFNLDHLSDVYHALEEIRTECSMVPVDDLLEHFQDPDCQDDWHADWAGWELADLAANLERHFTMACNDDGPRGWVSVVIPKIQ